MGLPLPFEMRSFCETPVSQVLDDCLSQQSTISQKDLKSNDDFRTRSLSNVPSTISEDKSDVDPVIQ